MDPEELRDAIRGCNGEADRAAAKEMPRIVEYTMCAIIDNDRMLLKYANRGIGIGKWNFPGGKIDAGEGAEESARREVFEETGLEVENLFYHGKKDYYDGTSVVRRVHIFSTKSFSGTLQSSEEGEIAWFKIGSLPFEKMWKDMKIGLDWICNGRKFDITIYYADSRANEVVGTSLATDSRQKRIF